MTLAVIVPVYNGGSDLQQCLAGIAASTRRPDRVVVVDDGSTDDAMLSVREFGYECLVLEDGPKGPARARNRGARFVTDADILVFVDADVVVHPGTIELMEWYLRDKPGVAAVFGSYDDMPAERNVPSLYKNLLHHHTHQIGKGDASTFWAGCGAVRRVVFEAVGGFDETYTRPSIEDIELGLRMTRSGYRIRLCPDLLATHLKRWTVTGLIRTDILARALPWSRLIVERDAFINDLNLSATQRLAALAALMVMVSGFTSIWYPVGATLICAAALGVFVAVNRGLFELFFRAGGVRLVFGGAVLHLIYYCYSAVVFSLVRLNTLLHPGQRRLADLT
ncbi:MAG: glycosyltransferase [Gammaproteobacteria bacterium]|nr:glycosyltransferase [Gammaproteobacteria bacterium]